MSTALGAPRIRSAVPLDRRHDSMTGCRHGCVAFRAGQPHGHRARVPPRGIEAVAVDMWEPFLQTIQKQVPEADFSSIQGVLGVSGSWYWRSDCFAKMHL